MRSRVWRAAAATLAIGWGAPAAAQDVPASAPRMAVQEIGHQQDADRVLDRTVALRLVQIPLAAALDSLSRASGLRIAYSTTELPAGQLVTLISDRITVRAALASLLAGTGTVAVAPRPGVVRFEPVAETGRAAPSPRSHDGGTITGAVVDSLTAATIPYVIVRIEETGQSVQSGSQGRYTLADVTPGQYHVTARRVGFIAHTRPVTVEDGKVATLDFKLSRPPTKLDEIVTTALGDQRRYEVGNDIATINVDSLAPTVPATSMTDVITSRAPGVQVVEAGGLAGSGGAIRIRGQSSMLLQGDPIIIVDGVRQDNTAGTSAGTIFESGAPSPNRLNDIDFNQIETINILKGPSASTEYGTDAANGVIVITTKRGTSGKTQWNASAEQDGSGVPVGFPEYYYSWGHLTDGTHASAQCPVLPIGGGGEASNGPPYNTGSSFGTCAVDSVTHFNPLNHARTSLFGAGLRSKYDLSVGGGTDAIRFYVAGGLSNDNGTVRLPPVFRSQALANGIPSSEFKPNALDQRSLRATTTLRLGSTADLTVTTAYMSTFADLPASSLVGVSTAYVVIDDSAHQYGYAAYSLGDRGNSPIALLGRDQRQQEDRVTGGMTASWRPLDWLTAHATVGIDHGAQNNEQRILPEASIFAQDYINANGFISQTQTGTDIYSADVRASATASPLRWLRLTTSLGFQFADTRTSGLVAMAATTRQQPTLNGASGFSVTQLGDRSATLGGYVEEGFNLFNALYWSLAMRLDAGSGFGQAIRDAAYPKFDLSFPVLKNGPTTLRLRTALGAAGRQPNNGANRQLFDITRTGFLNGGPLGVAQLIGPGNPNLKPERSMEYEGGFDFGLWDGRVSVGLTGYWKSTKDALIDQQLGFDLAALPYEENIGDIRNNGLEATASALVVRTRAVSWSFNISAATNHSKLLRVDSGFTQSVIGAQRQVVGYPLYGYWARGYKYADANHDGILQPSEMTVDEKASFVGPSLPTVTGALSTHIGLLRNTFTVGAEFSYAGGYRVLDENAQVADNRLTSKTANDPHAPLWQQARSLTMTAFCCGGQGKGYFEDGTYVRFRELSLTYALPQRWTRLVGAHALSVTGAVRNLALWSRFGGADPEASNPGVTVATSGARSVNNDIRDNGTSAVPLTRYWFLRLNLGW